MTTEPYQGPRVSRLDEAIDSVLSEMAGVNCDSDEYRKMVAQLVQLYKLTEAERTLWVKEIETRGKLQQAEAECRLKDAEGRLKDAETLAKTHEINKPDRVSMDTWAIVVGNLVGILVIVGYERANVITSKALNFILKTR